VKYAAPSSRAQGLGASEIAKALGIGRASVYRVLEAPA
jgi:DNA-binding IclR family transcriptional regulator